MSLTAGIDQSLLNLLHSCAPTLDEAVCDYLVAYIQDPPEEEDESGADSASLLITLAEPFLLDAGATSDQIREVCQQLAQKYPRKQPTSHRPSKLAQPVSMHHGPLATSKLGTRTTDLEWVGTSRKNTTVDTKKLEKAEAKIRSKLEKRDRKNKLYEASRLISSQVNESEMLKINPVLDYTTTKGKSKDIKIERFDISFAGKRILNDSSLTLTFSRRYGLIGRNGIGKSTLLRNISRRELDIPTHISILHVEQEMVGDETIAIEAVISADIFRAHLLKEAAELDNKLNSDIDEEEKTKCGLKLNEVHAKLQEIEADKAEAK